MKQRILLWCGVVFTWTMSAMNMNSGIMVSYNANINAQVFNHNGLLKALNDVNIRAHLVKGSGSLYGKNIIIMCDEFEFTGTISCDETCTVCSKKPFDHSLFKREGNGTFTVIIGVSSFEQHTESTLLDKACSQLADGPLDSFDEVFTTAKNLRHDAYINGVEEAHFASELDQEFASRIAYYAKRVHLKRDNVQLENGLCWTAGGAIGLGVSALGIVYRQWLTRSLCKYMPNTQESEIIVSSLGIGAASICALIISTRCFERWLNPRYKEKYEGLLRVREWTARAFDEPYVDAATITRF